MVRKRYHEGGMARTLKGIRSDLRHHEKEDDKSMREIAQHERQEMKTERKGGKGYHHSSSKSEGHAPYGTGAKGEFHHAGGMHGAYDGMSERRRQEVEDSGMIREEHGECNANLPLQAIIKPWPKYPYGQHGTLDDTLTGVDRQINDDGDEMKHYQYPEKY